MACKIVEVLDIGQFFSVYDISATKCSANFKVMVSFASCLAMHSLYQLYNWSEHSKLRTSNVVFVADHFVRSPKVVSNMDEKLYLSVM